MFVWKATARRQPVHLAGTVSSKGGPACMAAAALMVLAIGMDGASAMQFDPALFVRVEGAADTLVLQTPDKQFDVVVRLAGIRSPRAGEPWWAACATRLGRFLRERDLAVAVVGAPFEPGGAAVGRILADRGRVDVAATLVRSGCARVETGADGWLAAQEAAARAERRGIWADPR